MVASPRTRMAAVGRSRTRCHTARRDEGAPSTAPHEGWYYRKETQGKQAHVVPRRQLEEKWRKEGNGGQRKVSTETTGRSQCRGVPISAEMV